MYTVRPGCKDAQISLTDIEAGMHTTLSLLSQRVYRHNEDNATYMGYRYRRISYCMSMLATSNKCFPEYEKGPHMRLGELHRSDACGS